MLERYAFYVIALGALLGVIGFFWLVVRAFRQRVLWGLALILFPPMGLLFIWRHYRAAVGPVCVLLLAAVVTAAPYAVSYYERHFVPLQPYEQVVDGELRITLTGLKDFDYAVLRQKPQTVVLQMANPDVDDRVLENLKGMDRLEELDLNGTQITDEGLAVVAALPNLKTLRIARTKITDEGFRSHLLSKESLVHLDLTGTEVKGKTKREWKKQKPEEREHVD
jgi:hypothetical protein